MLLLYRVSLNSNEKLTLNFDRALQYINLQAIRAILQKKIRLGVEYIKNSNYYLQLGIYLSHNIRRYNYSNTIAANLTLNVKMARGCSVCKSIKSKTVGTLFIVG